MRRLSLSALAVLCIGAVTLFVRTHPLVFNESFFGHAHCIKGSGLALMVYAHDHGGRFPYHTNGYGDALLLLTNELSGWWAAATGPGYDQEPFLAALASGTPLPERACGRVYVQALSDTNDSGIALLFDKIATPGGDHCHLLGRLWAPKLREVWTVRGEIVTVQEQDWPAFAQRQIVSLVSAGISRKQAEALYEQAR